MVPQALVRGLNVRLTEVAAVLQQWGVGSARMLVKAAAASPADQKPMA